MPSRLFAKPNLQIKLSSVSLWWIYKIFKNYISKTRSKNSFNRVLNFLRNENKTKLSKTELFIYSKRQKVFILWK